MNTTPMPHLHSHHHQHPFWGLPVTTDGRRAARLFTAGIIAFVMFTVVVTLLDLPIQEGTGAVIGMSTLALIGLVIAAALPLTLWAIIHYGERSIINFLIIVPSTVAIVFALGEIFVPH